MDNPKEGTLFLFILASLLACFLHLFLAFSCFLACKGTDADLHKCGCGCGLANGSHPTLLHGHASKHAHHKSRIGIDRRASERETGATDHSYVKHKEI